VGAHRWLRLGHTLASLIPYPAGLLSVYVLSPPPRHIGAWTVVWLAAGLIAGLTLGVLIHELGHVLAIRLAGGRPTALHLLGPPDRVTFHIGSLQVGIGIKPGGEVEYPGAGLTAAQAAGIAVAGPAADLITAPLALLLPVARWAAVLIAVLMAASGLENLIPGKTEDGSLSDGVLILRARARTRLAADIRELLAAPDWSQRPDAASELISGWALDVPEAEDYLKQLPGDRDMLLRLYAQEWPLPRWPETEILNIVHALSWKVVAKPDVSPELADLAATRVEWVLEHLDKRGKEAKPRSRDVRHTLATIRLRQGRTDDVSQLCADALAADLDPDDRATVLATVAMAKHQRLLLDSARQALDEALALDPEADLVAEAAGMLTDDKRDTMDGSGHGTPTLAREMPLQ
jgi:Zn-dependent protease